MPRSEVFSRPPPSTARPSLRVENQARIRAISSLAMSRRNAGYESRHSWAKSANSVCGSIFGAPQCHSKCHRRRPRRWPNRLPLYRSARPGEIGPIRSTIAHLQAKCESSVVATVHAQSLDSGWTEIVARPVGHRARMPPQVPPFEDKGLKERYDYELARKEKLSDSLGLDRRIRCALPSRAESSRVGQRPDRRRDSKADRWTEITSVLL